MFLFKKKEIEVYSPVSGKLSNLHEVPDKTFAEEMMGPGCAVTSNDGHYYAPVDGTITVIAETKHAYGITGDNGVEILVHMGIDSFKTKGKGFNFLVNINQHVKAGDPVVDCDMDYMKSQDINMITPVIVLNSDNFTKVIADENKEIKRGDVVLKCCK